MHIKLQQKGEMFPSSYALDTFEQKMGIRYITSLEFIKPSLYAKIIKKCARALKKKQLEESQKWLGFYYAQEISNPPSLDLAISWRGDLLGYGVVTYQPITKQTFVGEYVGVVRKKRLFGELKNAYCFDYPILLQEEPIYVIDAALYGNYTRYINHKTEGNLNTICAFSGGVMHILLYANQNIPAGAELFYDYGENYWRHRKSPIEVVPKPPF